ncbi:uncharacterized protein LOC103710629 isoform X2 [Phoenix dactylifera]|uniref:Uncharacterized protein LOC103710629 isoform X2 n=1 Tax=Phoenix dactylifera TaxID=42345 RepID=A0A8B7MUQ2_PHODC|nr:uncharacterized protein LOC103710629 isoform X2 [Phoenix dactylifera]
MESLPDIYALTGLQIGDIQSYVSRAFLYFAPLSKRLLILVDNRPWLMNKQSRSTKLWQLMVTKYRISPFTNTRVLQKDSKTGSKYVKDGGHQSNHDKSKRSYRWLPSINSAKWQERYLFPVMDLSKALQGFLVFEVIWKDVHGINYLNELQADTSLALEVRSMTKWEFFSPEQASSCISLWFSGRISETQSLKIYLRKLSDLDVQHWNPHSFSRDMLQQKAFPLEVLLEDEFLDVQEPPSGTNGTVNNMQPCNKENSQYEDTCDFYHDSVNTLVMSEEKKSLKRIEMEEEPFIAPTQYADTLILFKSSDSLLPFKLRKIIMSDIRLLTLLESGLPSWVIFFQSYPLFCHFYRPWMRPLARTLYILISLVTVMIGFYDLYKNVPLLKAAAARLCGPLFSWIEEWDMVTRIQYLGTMLFLQNLRKSFKWLLVMSRAIKAIFTTISQPFIGPFSSLWNACAKMKELFSSRIWFMIESMYGLVIDIIEVLLWPFEFFYSYIWSTATLVYPLVCSIWKLVLAPIKCALMLANLMGSLLSNSYALVQDVWETISSIFQFTYLSETHQASYDVSVLEGLWNDLFSQVFRAVRSIIKGLSTFFIACNRHRLRKIVKNAIVASE